MVNAMTFLLFLVSLAVLEYVIRRPEKASRTGTRPIVKERVKAKLGESAAALTPGLLALGEALDQCGRGQMPGSAAQPQEVPRPQRERV